MPKESNIVHRYFRKKYDHATILLRINPIQLTGLELTLAHGDKAQLRQVAFDDSFGDDLRADGFEEANALEFNLYYSGLVE
jgi:hypothetical protein